MRHKPRPARPTILSRPYETRRQRERQKSNRFNEQNNHSACASRFIVHFFAVPAQNTTWNDQILSLLENGNGKPINCIISVRTRVRALLFSAKLNSLLLSNWALWNNREKKNWKDAKSTFQRRFHGRRRCRIVRSLLSPGRRWVLAHDQLPLITLAASALIASSTRLDSGVRRSFFYSHLVAPSPRSERLEGLGKRTEDAAGDPRV